MRGRRPLVSGCVEGLDHERMLAVYQLTGVDRNLDLTHVLAGSGLPPAALVDVLLVIEHANCRSAAVCEDGELLDPGRIGRGVDGHVPDARHRVASKEPCGTHVERRGGRIADRYDRAKDLNAACEVVRVRA